MMSLLVFVALVCHLALPAAAAQGLSALPTCSLLCLESMLPTSSCNSSDFACICADSSFMNGLSQCVSANCTVRQALATESFTATACGVPVRNIGPIIDGVAAGFGASALFFSATRLITRLSVTATEFGRDDICIFIATVALFPITASQFIMTKRGLGKDIWAVPLDNIDTILLWYYIAEVLYILVTAMTKLSLLLFYLRIFPMSNTRWKIQVTIAACLCYLVAFTFAILFQCSPVKHAWQFWDNERPGKCVNTNAMVWALAALNIFFDVSVIILPLPDILKLSLSRRKKIYLIFMFSLGFFVTIVSIIRLQSLVKFALTQNFTYDNAPAAYWSLVELNVSIICVCLPTLRPFLRALAPRWFASTTRSGNPYELTGSLVRPGITKTVEHSVSTHTPASDSDIVHLVDFKNSPHQTGAEVDVGE